MSAATTVLQYPPPPVQARAAYLVDMSTGRVLYAKNSNARLAMASTTKITTAALVLAHSRLADMVTVSNAAATIGQSTMSLQRGERLDVLQLLYGLMLNSGNDAAIALAEHVGGTVGHFVSMMNGLARALGMTNTHYVTPHGLDARGHYTSAKDLATMALYAMRDPTFRKIVATESYHIAPTRHNNEHWLGNINRVMFWFPGVDGVKPGDTDNAGLCQVVSDWRNGHHLLAVLLNTPTLVTDIRNLLDYGSRDFNWVQAPAFWDSPADSIAGGSKAVPWTYYLGAGHYVGGLFQRYFQTHGGLQTFGYPRTDEIDDGGKIVQFFEGAELIADPRHHTVYPANLGQVAAHALVPRVRESQSGAGVDSGFWREWNRLGGRGVIGPAVTAPTWWRGYRIQFYRYGALVELNGGVSLIPVGDLAMHLRGWLPASGAADSYPPTMAPIVLSAIHPQHGIG